MGRSAEILDGRTAVPVSDGYALILPEPSKMTPFTREAIMTARIEAEAVRR